MAFTACWKIINENIESFLDVITAEMPTEDDCRILHIDTREPLLVKPERGYNDRGELVEFSIAKHIAKLLSIYC